MALRIELWTDAGLVDGLERWWDDVDAWMDSNDNKRGRYPITASFDPYGFAVIPGSSFPALLAELSDIAVLAPAPVAAIASRLTLLCERGITAAAAELRLVGD